MSISIKEDTDLVYNRNYKVCYYTDGSKDKTGTFTNKLTNADNTYFWFSSVEYGLSVIRQDMIVYMGCVDKSKKVEDKDTKINHIILLLCLYDRNNALEELKSSVQYFKNLTSKESELISGNIETLKYLFPNFKDSSRYCNMYNGIKLNVDNDFSFGVIKIR